MNIVVMNVVNIVVRTLLLLLLLIFETYGHDEDYDVSLAEETNSNYLEKFTAFLLPQILMSILYYRPHKCKQETV
ncbi:Hypothetical predicted protein [Octopus vulgaris]|uniref:Uncharacterized protein n=1 Tax=Octopus vulgaris TaxID=6645 RepID=A0AA36F2G1_OCTVU|nr:Hypothetical predicted protein [Octopus vulgaris]